MVRLPQLWLSFGDIMDGALLMLLLLDTGSQGGYEDEEGAVYVDETGATYDEEP